MEAMTQEDSYADRRQLFKNIWDTAMQINEKDADIMNKPKVIKTLRLDEVDKCVIGKKKRERIKNLRTVCNKILDFCDRQDADDTFYEQMVEEQRQIPEPVEIKPKKIKVHRRKKRIRRSKSLMSRPRKTTEENTSEDNENTDLKNIETALSNYKPSSIFKPSGTNMLPGKPSVTSHRVVKKKRSKGKKGSDPLVLTQHSSGSKMVNASARGRAVIKRVRELLAVHKVMIS